MEGRVWRGGCGGEGVDEKDMMDGKIWRGGCG